MARRRGPAGSRLPPRRQRVQDPVARIRLDRARARQQYYGCERQKEETNGRGRPRSMSPRSFIDHDDCQGSHPLQVGEALGEHEDHERPRAPETRPGLVC